MELCNKTKLVNVIYGYVRINFLSEEMAMLTCVA